MIERKFFNYNRFYGSADGQTKFIQQVLDFVNESGLQVISINEIQDEHYNHTITIWYKRNK